MLTRIYLAMFLLASPALAESLTTNLAKKFIHDSQTHVFSVGGQWGPSDDLALEIRARTLFLEHAPTRLRKDVKLNLLSQIEKQTDELISLEMATPGTQVPEQCRAGLEFPGLRGWTNPEDVGAFPTQAKIKVPPCTPNSYDTGMDLIAVYDAARTLAAIRPDKAKRYFDFGEEIFKAWGRLMWNPDFHFYEKFYTREINPQTGHRRTFEVMVGNTNALMGLAHLSAVKTARQMRVDHAVIAYHEEKIKQIAESLETEFLLPEGAVPLDPHLEYPQSWHYSRNVYWQPSWGGQSVYRPEDTPHASFTMEFLSRLPEFKTYLSAFARLFLRNVVIIDRRAKESLVCVRDRKLDGEKDRRRADETDWYIPVSAGICKEGYVATSAFYNSVANAFESANSIQSGRRAINARGTSRRMGWGWLDLCAEETKILGIFVDLYQNGYLQAGPNESIHSENDYTEGNLYLLAKLYVAVKTRSEESQ